jgi:hypothetical protein
LSYYIVQLLHSIVLIVERSGLRPLPHQNSRMALQSRYRQHSELIPTTHHVLDAAEN